MSLTPLYQRVMGDSWNKLPPQIRELHSVVSTASFDGVCTVDRGGHPFLWLMAELIGFPRTGADQDINVKLMVEGDGERWIRTSGGRSFSSVQHQTHDEDESLVRETLGPVFVDMALVVEGENLRYIVRRWGMFGMTMPLALGPRTKAIESVRDGKFSFDVEVEVPFAGRIVRYRGLLAATK